MPLFEYACQACRHEFEAYVRASDVPACPACASTDLQRRLSVFAAHTSAASGGEPAMAPGGSCGRCGDPRGPGACSMN